MAVSGWRAEVQTLIEHGAPPIGLLAYLGSGEFLSALFENWESEFLQMSAYVVLTAMLFQRGSAESRDPDAPEDEPRPNAGKPSLRGTRSPPGSTPIRSGSCSWSCSCSPSSAISTPASRR